MTEAHASGAQASAAQALERRIGCVDHGRPGPTLLATGGIHGNEPAGVRALRRVVDDLRRRELPMRGRFVALAGNLQALARRQRFLVRDLNRGWSREALDALAEKDPHELGPEDVEQRELLAQFEEVDRTATGPILFVDLHTSSAEGSPFLCLADTIDNRRLGFATGVPIILGIEETIEGASLEWFAERGIAGFAVEGGQHDSEAAVDNLEAVLWLLLVRLGMVLPEAVDTEGYRARLRAAVGGAPAIVEIVHRQVIAAQDRFRMEPGFVNFARVEKGRLLATDRRGEVRAQLAGHVMLPLYQQQGDDGYFLARRVWPFWLWLARWLRALRVGAVLPLLPGVRRDPDEPDTLLANPRVARLFVVEIFHLLGFRKRRVRADGTLAFRRRRSRRDNRRLGRAR